MYILQILSFVYIYIYYPILYIDVYIPVTPVSSRTACLSKKPGFQYKILYFTKRAVLLRWDLVCNDIEQDRAIYNISQTIIEHVRSLSPFDYTSSVLPWHPHVPMNAFIEHATPILVPPHYESIESKIDWINNRWD